MDSDGRPWRPFVHILDISQAIDLVLRAPRDVVHGQIFNVGSNLQNYQVREVAEIIAEAFPGCRTQFGDSSGDHRNYRANFDKIREHLPFETRYDVARGAQQLLDVFRAVDMSTELFESRGHTRIKQIQHLLATGQIDERFFWVRAPPALAGPGRTRRSRHEAVTGGPRRLAPHRAHPDRRRPRVLRPDLGRGVVRAARGRDPERPDEPVDQPPPRDDPRAPLAGARRTASRSSCAARAGPSSTWPSISVPIPRRTASGRATSSTPRPGRWSSSRSAAPTATRRSRTTRRSATRCPTRTCRDRSAASAGTTRRSRSAGPSPTHVIVSEKDAAWPDLDLETHA